MEKKNILEALIAAIETVQEQSGEKPVKITVDIVPMRDLPGFESLRSFEVVSVFVEQVKWHLDENPFLGAKGLMSIGEIVELVFTKVNTRN
jgi:hypothetical protein